jgi:hypothetical protein
MNPSAEQISRQYIAGQTGRSPGLDWFTVSKPRGLLGLLARWFG